MKWTYTFAKYITLTDYYKQYLHETSYTSTTSKVKGYIKDTNSTFFLRNSASGTTTSSSLNYTSATATRYRYGSKYSLSAPVIEENNNTYTQCTIKVTNNNIVSVTYYDSDLSSSGTTIAAGKSITYNYSWTKGQYEQESHTFQGYFSATNCTSSSTKSLSVSKPYDVKPTLSSPVLSYAKGTGLFKDKYKISITNNNSVEVDYKKSGTDIITATGTISANSTISFYVDQLSSYSSRTYTITFSKSGYDDRSSSLTIS